MDERIAKPGHIWVCTACGKTSYDKYGEGGGWDESCMLNSSEYPIKNLVYAGDRRRVVRIKDAEPCSSAAEDT